MAMEEGATTTVNFPQGMNPWGMNGWGQPWQKYGMSGSALGIGIAGLVAGGLALLGGRIGNLGMGGNGCGPQYATTRDLDYERALTERDAKIGKLESQLYTDQQDNIIRAEIQAGNALQARLNDGVMSSIKMLQQQAEAFAGMQMSVLKPSVLAPSQAVLTQFQSAMSGKTAAADASKAG